MAKPETALDVVLHRLISCPRCTQPLQMRFEKDVIHLYCLIHGRFEVRYLDSDWVITYKFPEEI